ncbi:unnamed protein product [Protopolystoma xenopodis]|uniref:Uncharacterized protein n=1 Tax=Protopolystoma xenopodis TaxID=117903 RepID=A0A448X2K6_9PLAT|nr:unnamed protein product [Protopolystoma xenopodis]
MPPSAAEKTCGSGPSDQIRNGLISPTSLSSNFINTGFNAGTAANTEVFSATSGLSLLTDPFSAAPLNPAAVHQLQMQQQKMNIFACPAVRFVSKMLASSSILLLFHFYWHSPNTE